MTVGQDLMEKYPIGVSERIASEIDEAVLWEIKKDRRAGYRVWFIIFWSGVLAGYLLNFFAQ